MKYAPVVVTLFLLLFGCNGQPRVAGLAASSNPINTEPVNKNISVGNFGAENVIGYLGPPLGQIVRVTGTAIDGDSTRRKSDQGKTLLKIETVNGETADIPFVFEFLRSKKSVEKPNPGDQFDFYVHEYGAFEGVVVPPPQFNIEYVSMAHDGFHYRPFITIHKSNN